MTAIGEAQRNQRRLLAGIGAGSRRGHPMFALTVYASPGESPTGWSAQHTDGMKNGMSLCNRRVPPGATERRARPGFLWIQGRWEAAMSPGDSSIVRLGSMEGEPAGGLVSLAQGGDRCHPAQVTDQQVLSSGGLEFDSPGDTGTVANTWSGWLVETTVQEQRRRERGPQREQAPGSSEAIRQRRVPSQVCTTSRSTVPTFMEEAIVMAGSQVPTPNEVAA